jgi:short-subunit dehydrogenase
VKAVVDLTRRFLPGMIARRRGGVLNVASVEGFIPVPYQAVYAAAKAFMLSFTRALAYETMGTRVRVAALAPGAVTTAMHAKAGAEYSRYVQLFPVMSAEEVARIGYRKFMRGKKLIVTGWFNRISVFLQRFVPDFALVPLIGWFFRVRDAEGNLQMPRALTAQKSGNGRMPAGASSESDKSLVA